MSETNLMLIIPDTMKNTLGLLLLILALLYMLYCIITILMQKKRVDELSKLSAKIESCHKKYIKSLAQKEEQT